MCSPWAVLLGLTVGVVATTLHIKNKGINTTRDRDTTNTYFLGTHCFNAANKRPMVSPPLNNRKKTDCHTPAPKKRLVLAGHLLLSKFELDNISDVTPGKTDKVTAKHKQTLRQLRQM